MNVLEIHPSVCYWYICDDLTSLRQIAADVADNNSERIRVAGNQARLHILGGGASTFNLAPRTFDLIVTRISHPSLLHSVRLSRKCAQWLKPDGACYQLDDRFMSLSDFLS